MYDIYSNARNDAWRFTLGVSGNNPLFVIGLNPSTATQEKSDTTVAKAERVALSNGYDGFVMLNLYPIRATDYERLPLTTNQTAFTENIEAIVSALAAYKRPTVWVAWGESISARTFFIKAVQALGERLKESSVKFIRFGPLTRSGHPRHPSRLSYSWHFSSFDMDKYQQGLG